MAGQRQPMKHAAGTSTSGPVSATADANTYGSSSTLSASMATGSHVLTVKDYSGFKRLHAANWLLPLNRFTVGGYSWHIKFSPNGFCPETADWICFGLRLEPPGTCLTDDAAMVVLRTTYSLLDQAGQPLPSSSTRVDDSMRILPSMLGSWNWTRFMKRQRFETFSCVKDNRFCVRCDVTLVTTTCRPSGVIPPPDLRRHLGDLLATGVGADVTLEVGGEAFAGHRSVLAARSPVFKAELFGGPQHKEEDVAATTMTTTNGVLRIHDIEPTVFKALLHFIYTDTLPEMDGAGDDQTAMARSLLAAAQRYKLEGLKRICEDVLCISCPRRSAKPSLVDQTRAKFGGCSF